MKDATVRLTRRQALKAASAGMAGMVLAGHVLPALAQDTGQTVYLPLVQDPSNATEVVEAARHSRDYDWAKIEEIMENTASVSNGVAVFEYDRTDLNVSGPHGLPWKPGFQTILEIRFQPLGNGQGFLNAVMALVASELNPVIDAIFANGLVIMAEHQHFYDEDPQIWHIHLRGQDDLVQLAQAIINVIKVTGTPLPQSKPANPTTPLPVEQLASIIGGPAQVGSDGVVVITVPRAETIKVAGVPLKPQMGVEVNVRFEPLGDNGQAVCAPDYALIAPEVNPALMVSRAEGFEVHCLYNQETAEHPQLFFSHNLKTGDAVELAKEVSKVLDQMNVKRQDGDDDDHDDDHDNDHDHR
ncbi:MAG: DUF1259 domain-containing protein [Caldilineaceae bacterium]